MGGVLSRYDNAWGGDVSDTDCVNEQLCGVFASWVLSRYDHDIYIYIYENTYGHDDWVDKSRRAGGLVGCSGDGTVIIMDRIGIWALSRYDHDI